VTEADAPISIWQTITYFINDSTETEDVGPLRHEIAKYVVGEPLEQIGILDCEYSYTEVSVDDDIPDAFALLNDNRTLSLVVLVGQLGHRKLPEIPFSDIKKSLISVASQISEISAGSSTVSTEGREGVGEYVSLVKSITKRVKKIEVKVLAVGSVKATAPEHTASLLKEVDISGGKSIPISVELFDVPTLQDEWDRSSKTGTIDLDLTEFLGHPLSCLKAGAGSDGFDTYLAIIPGDSLANIYARFKTRILQKNLRNFLQATGKINKGIQSTLRENPERFLAYNNGLTITATEAELNESGKIVVLRDFQIVNGGQTTASLDYFKRFAEIDDTKRQEILQKVSVQAKITVVDTLTHPSFIDDVSNFANSQNKVNLSDFGARNKFQETLAKLMRDNIELQCRWDDGKMLYWYYEAFRGGYLTSKYQLTGQKRKIFENAFPKDQVITKLDLAKCENGWDGYPHFVCRGAEKNFNEWNRRTHPQSRPAPDIEFCRELVAKFLLFKKFESEVKNQGYAGFKSQIVSLAFSYFIYLLEIRDYEIDLYKVWEFGLMPDELTDPIVEVIDFVHKFLPIAAGQEDPAQWAKKPIAWEKMKETTKKRLYPRIVRPLKSAEMLRPLTFDLQVTCARAMEELSRSRQGIRKIDLLEKLGIDDTNWAEIRRTLLNSYDIIQLGAGTATTYKTNTTQ